MEIIGQLTRKKALVGAGMLLAALALGGKVLLGAGTSAPLRVASGPPVGAPSEVAAGVPGEAAEVAPFTPSTPSTVAVAAIRTTIVVHVVGAVRRPGVYRLREGARAADAVARAGGSTARADLEAIDLAAPIADGQQIAVPRRGVSPLPPASVPGVPGTPAGVAAGAPAPATSPAGPLHLNTATPEQLDALPGIGPTTAQKIIDYRAAHGPFRSVDELDAISGIGPARIEKLRKLVAP